MPGRNVEPKNSKTITSEMSPNIDNNIPSKGHLRIVNGIKVLINIIIIDASIELSTIHTQRTNSI